MRYVKWTVIVVFWCAVVAFLHYTLPQRDIARITGTYEDRIDVSQRPWAWSSAGGTSAATGERLVFFMQTRQANGKIVVYRNEDTGWGWPPYFKFNTANLHAEAESLKSDEANPRWVVIRHYGWRAEILSIFPNAISLREIDDPNKMLIPWFNIAFLITLFAIYWAIRVRWVRFREARLDPAIESVEDKIYDGRSWFGRMFGRR